jgi:hypothetical protein
MTDERLLKYFTNGTIGQAYRSMAEFLCQKLVAGPERTVALRKLLESQDAALRQVEDQRT